MKGRSHRLPRSDPPDDWGDGSWTVDCVCGVNFDDGEEMVNCDECGVWVHTRCSRFVKGETSFACDKCKSKKNRNDSEETEVAQLLVELPTKTMKMENPNSSSAPFRPPFRLWTDMPIEERVHVQGVPGGDPSLFQGLSKVFTPQLWKCTGYVPQKFNFQHREFPCWEEKREVDAKVEGEHENPVDRGAGVLFSLSKDIVPAITVDNFVGLRGSVEGDVCGREPFPEEMKREGEHINVGFVQNDLKKERNQLRPFGVRSAKRNKEDLGGSKDRRAKKARSVDKETDDKKRDSTPAVDAKKFEFHEDGVLKVFKTDFQHTKNEDRRDTMLPDPVSDVCLEATNDIDNTKNILSSKAHPSEGSSYGASRAIFPFETVVKEDKVDHRVPTRTVSSPKIGVAAIPLSEPNDVGSIPIKKEDVNAAVDGLEHLDDENHDRGSPNGGSSNIVVDTQKLKLPTGDQMGAAPELRDNKNFHDSNDAVYLSSVQPSMNLKMEADDDHSGGDLYFPSSPLSDVKLDDIKHLAQHPVRSADAQSSENLQVNGTAVSSFLPSGRQAQDVEKELETVSDHHTNENAELCGEPCRLKQESEGSTGPLTVQEGFSEPEHVSKNAEEPPKIGGTNPSPPALLGQCKVVVGIGKSSSTSSTVVAPQSSLTGSCKPPSTPASASTQRPIHMTKQRVKVNSYADFKKDHATNDVVRDKVIHEVLRKTIKEHPKASANSMLKASQTSRISHTTVFKRTLPDSNEQLLYPYSKASAAQNAAVYSGSGESASSLQPKSASHVQNKTTASGLSQKGEKFNRSSSQLSSKVNHSQLMHPPAPVISSAALSDEELALLLHQELNSSPRVPRVPRVRHASSTPQLASPTASSMLIKCTPNSGGKDQISGSRRKGKENTSKDGSRSSREPIDESKKMDGVPSSPDLRRQDSLCTADGSTKREADNESSEVVHSAKKNLSLVSTTTTNSGLHSSTEINDQNLSSILNSQRNISDDDADTIVGPAPRTLPGLIDEIMSKGRRMTYEELCNAVRPHWHTLRKHNGERYAYSSHSQAVLDCLRNRNEWAQLVDRGPKTNASRKRRKLDAEPPIAESEENEYDKDKTSKEVEVKSVESSREDFPKGKRKARKRRRLALQGRGIKDVRKRQKADALTDDDLGTISHSSDEDTEITFSEDESQGGRMCPMGSEASTSTDELETML
ncbi:hypothetical protein HHK36_000012 [Tetracentron sinense]|uniref:Zinc finger PHD-type domain-containing protein n=1 Tax=Tetracentron sinense TaxID=13715 RepID=A0A834ZQX6_TETSI|nr:hypothetical protein HHK36_000012 [Tetracentron sinense]